MARLLLSLALLLGIAHAQNPCVADVIAVAKEVAAGVKGIEAAISDCATSNQTVCEKDIDAAADDLAAAVKLATTAVNDCGGSASPNCTKAVNDLAADVKEAADKIADAVVNDCKPPWWQNIIKCKAAAAVVIADLKKAGADGKEALTECKTSATQMVEDA